MMKIVMNIVIMMMMGWMMMMLLMMMAMIAKIIQHRMKGVDSGVHHGGYGDTDAGLCCHVVLMMMDADADAIEDDGDDGDDCLDYSVLHGVYVVGDNQQ